MHFFRGHKLLTSALAITTLLFAFALVGCDEDTTPGTTPDLGGAVLDTGFKADTGGTTPKDKGAPVVDQPLWPDIWGPEGGGPKTDIFPQPDSYKPSPFGCSSDADCFGQKCCATPWGVKLCAPSCDIQP